MGRQRGRLVTAIALAALAGSIPQAHAQGGGGEAVRYLAFQLFTGNPGSREIGENFPRLKHDLAAEVRDLRDRIGTVGSGARRLGFITGPLSFDDSDEEVRVGIRTMFDIALETGVACGMHLDDSMFWGKSSSLAGTEVVEWLDWAGDPNTGRRLDWSPTPTRIAPQLCLNSPAVMAAVTGRAALIGGEVRKGLARLAAVGKEYLFIGVIAGWETQIGRDCLTGKSLGYHALHNAGFAAQNPPPDLDLARVKIVSDFVQLWAASLVRAGVPAGKVYSHIAFTSDFAYGMRRGGDPSIDLEPYFRLVNFSPPETAFNAYCVPGLSTYPQPGLVEQWKSELALRGNPPWASCEGSALDPAIAGRSGAMPDMEGYLGTLFNNGAVLVNLFGWAVGPKDNPFRRVAEAGPSIAAYRTFLEGKDLSEAAVDLPNLPPADLPEKLRTIQALLPAWIEVHGPSEVKALVELLEGSLRDGRYEEASRAADRILALVRGEKPRP
jgi:hypothetical protein